MIGLKRGTVALLPHDEQWEKIAADTIIELKNIFGKTAIDIQHVGSTAIKRIKAKPIIDIAVGVEDIMLVLKKLPMLERAGFSSSYNRFNTDLLYIANDNENRRTHQIHILNYDSEQWHNFVDFRDYMNCNYKKAKEYEKLKIKLAFENSTCQSDYTDGKHYYMQDILKEIKHNNS